MGITVKGQSLLVPDLVAITIGDIEKAIETSGVMRSYLIARSIGNKSTTRTRKQQK